MTTAAFDAGRLERRVSELRSHMRMLDNVLIFASDNPAAMVVIRTATRLLFEFAVDVTRRDANELSCQAQQELSVFEREQILDLIIAVSEFKRRYFRIGEIEPRITDYGPDQWLYGMDVTAIDRSAFVSRPPTTAAHRCAWMAAYATPDITRDVLMPSLPKNGARAQLAGAILYARHMLHVATTVVERGWVPTITVEDAERVLNTLTAFYEQLERSSLVAVTS